jgi:16S rRNA (uracil1498-N3)-methyltransferase
VHFFFDPGISEHSTHIHSDELVHFRSLRITAGEQIAVTSGQGFGFFATVIDPQTGQISLGERLERSPKTQIHLVQAIAKGGRDELALQACTELGIASATALQAERSVSRWDTKVQKNLERWEQIAIAAIKQSQQLLLPQIRYSASVADLQPEGVGLVLDPRATAQIGQIEAADSYTVVVGPEGGFSEHEVDKLVANGFTAVKLGDSVLRTSTAGATAVACLQLISGELGKRLD